MQRCESRRQVLLVVVSLMLLIAVAFPAPAIGALTTLATYGTPNPAAPAPSFTDNGGGSYSITASGTDFWGTSDNGSWLYDPLTTTTGDFTAIVRSTSFNTAAPLSALAPEWGRTGVMARANANANSANIATVRKSGVTNGADGPFAIDQQGRRYNGGATDRLFGESIGSGGFAANQGNMVWLALHRMGNYFYSQYAPDVGNAPGAWSAPQMREVSPDLTGPLLVGLEHQAHSLPRVNQANFDSFSVGALDPLFNLPPAPVTPVLFTYAQQPNGKWNRMEIDEYAFLNFDNAVTRAGSKSYNALPGHLATPRSINENRDIQGLISASRLRSEGLSQNTWVGVGDGAVEGEWRLTDAGNDLVWQGLGLDRTPPGSAVPGAFERWNRPPVVPQQLVNDEPNNSGNGTIGEDAAEIIRAGLQTIGASTTGVCAPPASCPAVTYQSMGRWNDLPPNVNTSSRFMVVEYETQLDARPEIPALPIQNGSFSVHMIYGHRGDIQHVRAVEALAYSTGLGMHHHSYQPMINFKDEGSGDGLVAGGVAFPGSNTAVADENNFALFAKGLLYIPEAGEYTFGFHGDDGSQLRIPGYNFSVGINQPGGVGDTALNHGESDFVAAGDVITFPRPTGSGTVLGQITLPAGLVPIEFSWFENGGGAHTELFVARGAQSTFNSAIFRPVGYRGQGERHFYKPGMVDLGGGNHFNIDVCDGPDAPTNPPSRPEDLHTVATAMAYLDNCAAGTPGYTFYNGMAAVLNHTDPGFPASGGSDAADLPFPGLDEAPNPAVDNNNWATRSTGLLDMPADGWVRFLVESDDGFLLFVDGAQFRVVSATNPAMTQVTSIGSPNDSVQAQYGTGNTNTVLEAYMTAGQHDLLFVHWDGNGGGYAQIRAGGMLLGSSAAMDLGLEFDPDGLQLVPEPSTWALAGIALAALAFARRRRSR